MDKASEPQPQSPSTASAPSNASISSTTNSQNDTALGLPTALKPVGFHNESNTCFFNSTFQALSATTPLISLLTSSPTSTLHPTPSGPLPAPAIASNLIPSLRPEATDAPDLYKLLPVTRAFESNLFKAWKLKDAGGGTYGSSEKDAGRTMSLRTSLRELARKYDQYDDYRQQDAHELLRHLLDSMEMEEKDIIKKLQPDPPKINTRRGSRRSQGSAGKPNVSMSPVAPQSKPLADSAIAEEEGEGTPTGEAKPLPDVQEILPTLLDLEDDARLIPFVDVLFGGSLASVVICETCKSVSHTYEGFLDISLSLKGDQPKPRKRDRFKAIAAKLKPKSGSKSAPSSQADLTSVVSDTEASEPESARQSRRGSMEITDGEQAVSRHNSLTLKTDGSSLKKRASFSFGKKKPSVSRPASSSSIASEGTSTPPVPEHSSHRASRTSSLPQGGPRPTAAQAAYIRRILNTPQDSAMVDPLRALRVANGQPTASKDGLNGTPAPTGADTDLEDCLRAFTGVEVLDGDNSFACKKCWRVKAGKYDGQLGDDSVLTEENEEESEVQLPPPSLNSTAPASPEVSASSTNSEGVPSIAVDQGSPEERPGRLDVRFGGTSHIARAPSPLRNHLAPSEVSFSSDHPSTIGTEVSSASSISSRSIMESANADDDEESSGDGLSDTSSEEDEPPTAANLPVGAAARPGMPPRRKSSHFVMRRAFKRYLIAKAPEVLVFHLKRFKQTQKTSLAFSSFYNLKKMDDFVSFPEKLDLAPFMAPDRNDYKTTTGADGLNHAKYMDFDENGPKAEPVMYQLYAIVVHIGSMIGGHYIAYCLVDPDRMFDDGSVTTAEPEAIEGTEDGDQSPITSKPPVMPAASNERKASGSSTRSDLGGGIKRPSFFGKSSSTSTAQLPQGKKDKRVWCYCSDTSIRLASLDEVLKARAYLCFYEKVQKE